MEDSADEQPPNCLEQSVLGRFSSSLLSDPAAASIANGSQWAVANPSKEEHINALKDHSILSRTSLRTTGTQTKAVTDPS